VQIRARVRTVCRGCCGAHMILYRTLPSAGALLLLALVLAGTAARADAQEGTVKSQHGAWQVVCKDPPPGAKNGVCAASQSVVDEQNENVGLTIYVQIFSNGERVLRVFAPLGILLPRGLGLRIDDKDFGEVPFQRCLVFGCQAQKVLDGQMVETMKGGKNAIFVVYRTQEEGIGIPVSLAGFKEALEELK
jgi:invasion protein IalB